jgi:hypothetical protein
LKKIAIRVIRKPQTFGLKFPNNFLCEPQNAKYFSKLAGYPFVDRQPTGLSNKSNLHSCRVIEGEIMKRQSIKIYTVFIIFLLAIIATGCSIDDDLDILERSINEYVVLHKKAKEGDIGALQRGTQAGNEISILLLKISLRAEKMTDAQTEKLAEILEKYANAME